MGNYINFNTKASEFVPNNLSINFNKLNNNNRNKLVKISLSSDKIICNDHCNTLSDITNSPEHLNYTKKCNNNTNMNNGDSDEENHNNHIENNHIKQERYMLKEVKNN